MCAFFGEDTVAPGDAASVAAIGRSLFTDYAFPFEVTSILLLMAIVGAMSLARRTTVLSATARVVPGMQVLAMDIVNPRAIGDQTAVRTETSAEAAHLLGADFQSDRDQEE